MNPITWQAAWDRELEIRREIERMDHRQDDPRDAALYRASCRKARRAAITERVISIFRWIHRQPGCETC